MKQTINIIFLLLLLGCGKDNPSDAKDQEDPVVVEEEKDDKEPKKIFIAYDNAKIQYEGRVEVTPKVGAYLYWPGTAVRVKFEGTGVKAFLQDFSTNNDNYFEVIIDGQAQGKIKLDRIRRYYTLADNLADGEHTVELFKINHMNAGYARGYSMFFGFELIGEGKGLDAPPLKQRKIEFYGNSITCGRSNEDNTDTDSPASEYENNYLAYGAITARHFNAQYHCIAMSGIGLSIGYTNIIMPELYDRINPDDASRKWDFTRYVPDIVVVNLFQNDASVLNTPSYNPGEFQKRYGGIQPTDQQLAMKYQAFIAEIRTKYPNTHIICTLGSMNAVVFQGGRYAQVIENAVESLNDAKVYTHFFTYKNTPRHPTVAEHQDMADSLIDFITQNINW